MSFRSVARRIYHVDVLAIFVGAMLVLGHRFTSTAPGAPAFLQDVPGLWMPLLAGVLLVGLRRRAYTQETPWIVATCAALAFVGIAAVFWRWNLPAFLSAIIAGSVLLVTAFVLRSRRAAEPLSRSDRFGLVAMIASVTLTVVLTEVVVRLVPGVFSAEIQQFLRGADPGNFGVAHPYIGHLHTPDNAFVLAGRDFRAVHHVDGLGFRNQWPWPDRADIVVVGDSVTFGQSVEDDQAWPHLVAEGVSPRRLINLGLIGAGPQQYLRVFETFGASLQPKLLLVGLFARNDFWDANVFDRWLQSGAGGNFMVWRDFGRARRAAISLRHPRSSLEGVLRSHVVPLVRRSHLYQLLRALRGGVDGESGPPPRIFDFGDGRRLELLEADFLNKSSAAQPGRREFQLVLDALRQIHGVAARQGTRVLMILLPGKEEVYLPLLDETTADPTRALRSALDEIGIEYLDLGPAFREHAASGEQLFLEVDGHPNRAGQALIARLVLEHVTGHAARYDLAE
jgi:hypothetical protein